MFFCVGTALFTDKDFIIEHKSPEVFIQIDFMITQTTGSFNHSGFLQNRFFSTCNILNRFVYKNLFKSKPKKRKEDGMNLKPEEYVAEMPGPAGLALSPASHVVLSRHELSVLIKLERGVQ
jgi:hypothetical protein